MCRRRSRICADEELALIDRHGLTPAQIGFRRGLEASYRGLRAQEFAEDAELCFRTTGECCFDMEALETALDEVEEPAETRRDGACRSGFRRCPARNTSLPSTLRAVARRATTLRCR